MRNFGRAIDLGDLGAARSVSTPFYSAAAQGTLYTPPRAAKPFIMKSDVIWRTLPGEESLKWPHFNPFEVDALPAIRAERLERNYSFRSGGMFDPDKITQHFMSASNTPVISSRPDAWQLVNAGSTRIKALILRSFGEDRTARRWVRRSGGDHPNCMGRGARSRVGSGHNCWSVEEEASIRAFIRVMMDWQTELKADMATLIEPRYRPAMVAAQSLTSEIEAAIGALSAFSKMLHDMLHYGSGASTQLQGQAVTWMAAAEHAGLLYYADGLSFGLSTVQKAMVDIRDLAEDMASLGEEVGEFYSVAGEAIDAAMKELWNLIRDWALEVANEALTAIGVEVAGAVGTGTSIPFIGLIIDALMSVWGTLTRDERPPGLKYDRFKDVRYMPEHLDLYGVMMYRAVAQHRARMQVIRRGNVSWPEPAGPGGAAAAVQAAYRGLRPDSGDAPDDAPPAPPRPRPRPMGPAKPLTPAGKAAIAVGSGVSLAGLVWWLWKRFR